MVLRGGLRGRVGRRRIFFKKPLDFRGAFLMDIIRETYHDPLFNLESIAAEGQFKTQQLSFLKGKI